MEITHRDKVTSKTLSIHLMLARKLLRSWPTLRGRRLLERLCLPPESSWPSSASFNFRYGSFSDASIRSWPWGYRELFLYGIMDIAELEVWERILKPEDVVVDGGANWGYWSLVASHLVRETGRVLSFEPVPKTSQALRTNVKLSAASNIEVFELALAQTQGQITINIMDSDPIMSQSSVGVDLDTSWSHSVKCKTITLDSILQEINIQPKLIKLDIEGGELFALQGATSILQQKPQPIITFEWNRVTAQRLDYSPNDTLDLLECYGYQPFLATHNGLRRFAERSDLVQWSPMVWAFAEEHLNDKDIGKLF